MSIVTDIEGHTLFALSDLTDNGDAKSPLFAFTKTPLAALVDHLYFVQASFQSLEQGYRARLTAVVDGELMISPLGSVIGLVIGESGGLSVFELEFSVEEQNDYLSLQCKLVDVPLTLRVSADILRPLQPGTNQTANSLDIPLGTATLSYASGMGVDLSFAGNITLPRCMIIDSGIIVSATAIRWLTPYSDNLPANVPADFSGLYFDDATFELDGLSLEAAPTLKFDYAFIGSGGFTGKLEADNLNLRGSLMSFECELTRVQVTMVQGAVVSSDIYVLLTLPFFDSPLGVEIGISLDGGFTVALSAMQPVGTNYQNGLVTLDKEDLFRLTIESLRFLLDKGVFAIALSGEFTPHVGGLEWPTFKVKELTIDSKGNVHLDGGWLDLPDHYSLGFYGFQIEITKLGFGKTESGRNWLGFSGALKLVDGLSAGASVEGLRITWSDGTHPNPEITLNGVGVEFEVPDVLRFKGSVSYEKPQDHAPANSVEGQHRFVGDIKLELISLDLEIDGTLVFGSDSDAQGSFTYFAMYLGTELPAGIPLFATGLALYGMGGIFALQYEPGRRDDEQWYSIQGQDWYHRAPVGASDLPNKWVSHRPSLALGAAVTIGTVSDNGFAFSGRMLLVIVFPGPILLIEGKASLLKERSNLFNLREEPLFRSLAVLDGRAGTFLFGLDAQYKYGSGGQLIDIAGSAEAFFSLKNADAWHLYLGMPDPREQRIRAEVCSLFQANAYLTLDARQLAMGAWIGYDNTWHFGPLQVTVEAWMDGNAMISRKPVHLSGDLWFHGKAALSVFGFGVGLSIDERFAAEVFDPFHLLADFHVGIDLPWFLPSFEVTIILEWGPKHIPPLLPMPLQEIAVEHFKVTTSWPLRRGTLLLPVYDSDHDGMLDDADRDGQPDVPPSENIQPTNLLQDLPVVPLDARPHLTFGRTVHDDAHVVGANPQLVTPAYERIGNPKTDRGPVRVRFGLKEVALERLDGNTWKAVARKRAQRADADKDLWVVEANPSDVKDLYGSWAPVPQLPSGEVTPGTQPPTANSKLWLWSINPFDYTRHTGHAWDEWFTDTFPDYPCIPDAPDRTICCDVNDLQPGTLQPSPFICHDRSAFVLTAQRGFDVIELDDPVDGMTRALCPIGQHWVDIQLGTPAKAVAVTIAPEKRKVGLPTCLDFRVRTERSFPNPLRLQHVSFRVLDSSHQPLPVTEIKDFGLGRGLDLGFTTQIQLPCPASSLQLRLSMHAGDVTISTFDARGSAINTINVSRNQPQPAVVTIAGQGISHLEITIANNETLLQEICFECEAQSVVSTTAVAYDERGQRFGPFAAQDNTIHIEGQEIRRVVVGSQEGERLCLVQMCANIGPDPADVYAREEMRKHLVDELARWQGEGEILEPHSIYRIKVVTTVKAIGEDLLSDYVYDSNAIDDHNITEYAYFRTEGPPGLATLSTPDGHPNPTEFEKNNELSDLSLYVRQTVPPTVPARSEKPPLPRPVYRAYDVGVEFNEDYVDLMYRIEHRDLGLYLYDNNHQPVRDAQGRLIVLNNRWGVSEQLILTEEEQWWITLLNRSSCASLDPTIISHDKALSTGNIVQVLESDTLYEARLIPLLLHEDFGRFSVGTTITGPSGTLDGWIVVDNGTNSTPSQWRIGQVDQSRYIEQTSNIRGGTGASGDAYKPGTLLIYARNPKLSDTHQDQPMTWTDYRLNTFIRSSDNGAIGMVFRYQDAAHFYLFTIDRQRKYRRLLRVTEDHWLILAEDDFVYTQDQDYVITIEALGNDLAVYQDGSLVFRVNDPALRQGTIGLYSWANEGARFTDVRVDDFRVDREPVVYRFEFITSKFAHFLHHLHSFQDETWLIDLSAATMPDAEFTSLLARAVTPTDGVTEDENRAYQTLADRVLGPAAHQNPPALRISRIQRDGNALALLVESPEPIDWQRTSLTLEHTSEAIPPSDLPGPVKLTEVTFGNSTPNEETVNVLLCDTLDMSGYQVQMRSWPGILQEPTGNSVLFRDDFKAEERGLLFQETFGANALDHYTIVDQGMFPPSSHWSVSGNAIVQTSNIWGGSLSPQPQFAEKPGTMAITGSPSWANVRIIAALRSTDDDAIGLVFRYQNVDHYYRFSMDHERGYRRLIKKVDGMVTVLWEDHVQYNLAEQYELTIEAYNEHLLGYLNHQFLFHVQDRDLLNGQVGLYCWANQGASFERLIVESLEVQPVLWQPAFEDMQELTVVDEVGAVFGPSQWSATGGVLTQSSNIHVVDSSVARPGTYAIGGSLQWDDVQMSVRLLSTDTDAIGIMFRFTDNDNYYRFSMDRQRNYRRLIKKVGGTVTILWQSSASYTVGMHHALTIRAVGTQLEGFLDGIRLFNVIDADLIHGQIGFYCWANSGAAFDQVIVTDCSRRLGAWRIVDEGTVNVPSVWQQKSGALLQTGDIHDSAPASALAQAGTYAVTGSRSWTDYRLTVKARSDDEGAIGVIFRYVDKNNYYRLSLDNQSSTRRLVKKQNGVFTPLWEDSHTSLVGEPFTLTVDLAGSRLVGYQGMARLFDVTDATHAAGQIGLYGWANTGMRFEHVEVRHLPLEAIALFSDRFALGDMSAWNVIDEGTISAPSHWLIDAGVLRQTSNIFSQPVTAAQPEKKGTQVIAGDVSWRDVVLVVQLQSFDDDAIGVVFRYVDPDHYYRFSMDRQRGYRRLVKNMGGVFTVLWEDTVAYTVGRHYEIAIAMQGNTFRGYVDGIPLFTVEDGDLSAGRIGLYCWANQDARFYRVHVYPTRQLFDAWLFSEDFASTVAGRWQFIDEGSNSTPSAWAMVTGALWQTSSIWGEAIVDAEKPGTYALAGEAAWTNYRLSVGLMSGNRGAIGVLFRYQDANHYYRFSMDRQQRYRRLIKKVGNTVTTLWEDTGTFLQGQPSLITVACLDSQIYVYLNGEQLAAVQDGDLVSGKIGLYCWRNPEARFTEVHIAEPTWLAYYDFSEEERLPAGTRIRIFAGNETSAPAKEPNIQQRFIASLDQLGRIRFAARGTDLRIVDASNHIGHMRRFLPDGAYTPIPNVRVLRKGDGTGAFLFIPSGTGSQLSMGQYRLHLIYRRDNRSVDSQSIVLKESGDSSDEHVILDIPWETVNN